MDEADPEDVEQAIAGLEKTDSRLHVTTDTVLIELEDAPDQLGIFPSDDASERWITASGESFVGLEEMR